MALNRRRLWTLLTGVWCVAVAAGFFPPVASDFDNFRSWRQMQAILAHEAEWNECLKDAGLTMADVIQKSGEKCREEAREQCRGSSFMRCAEDYLYQSCLKESVKRCRPLLFANPREIKESLTLKGRSQAAWERTRSFLESSYSNSFKLAILALFAGPIMMAFTPRMWSATRQWLTSK